jgi:pimeloyl-ACP methyl ester carboxylesterase
MKLRVVEYGQGPTIILIHGGPGLPGYMHGLGELLKNRFRVVEYYQRDFIKSAAKGPYSISSYVADLRSIVVEHGAGRPTIVAHSFGCALAVQFAKRHPLAASRLVLLNPVLDQRSWDDFLGRLGTNLRVLDPGIDEKLERQQARLSAAVGAQARLRALRKLHDLYWPGYFPTGRRQAGLRFAKVDVAAVEKIERDFLKKLGDDAFVKDLRRIKIPVTQIHGSGDPIPWRTVAGIFKRRTKAFRVRLVNKAGHFPWLDEGARQVFVKTLSGELSP